MNPIRHLACLGVLALACFASPAGARAGGAFRFESIVSLDDMRALIRDRFGKSSARAELRHIFITEAGGTLITHPTAPAEKYVYDINLCDFYVWRWNISADYDPAGMLQQVYVNGEPAFDGSAPDPLMPLLEEDKSGAGVYRMARPRPEASKGENSLGFILIDADANLDTADDQILMGGGPTRADPGNLGKLHGYKTVPWRSIFDSDAAKAIVPFGGACPAAAPD